MIKYIASLTLLLGSLISPAAMAADLVDFSSLQGATIDFTGGGHFGFSPGTNLQISGSTLGPGIVGLSGGISGIYTVGAITTQGGVSTAPVSGTGGFFIIDAAGLQLTGTLNFVNALQSGTGNFLNYSASVNISGLTYGGTNSALQALAMGPPLILTLNYTQLPPLTLSNQVAGAPPTSFSGSLDAPPPTINQVSNQSIRVGQTLVITNTSSAIPPVMYNLTAGPAGATLTPNGVFMWTPQCVQGSTTNPVSIWVIDGENPPQSNVMTFNIVVGECVEVTLGSAAALMGATTNVPVTLFSTAPITNLRFALGSFGARLTNVTFSSSNASVGTSSVQGGPFPQLTFGAAAGQALSNAVLGTVGFAATAGGSAFVPLSPLGVAGFNADGTAITYALGLPGQLILIGPQPLLRATPNGSGDTVVTLYGNPGSSYALQSSGDLMIWRNSFLISLTNQQQNLVEPPVAASQFFRAIQY
jgi:hypothetical protein